MIEARPGIREPHAAIEVSQSRRGQPHTVVLNIELEQRAVDARPHGDLSWCGPGTNAVLNGVFDERLQQKVGDECVQRLRLDVEYHCQTVAEARLFDLQVLGEEV